MAEQESSSLMQHLPVALIVAFIAGIAGFLIGRTTAVDARDTNEVQMFCDQFHRNGGIMWGVECMRGVSGACAAEHVRPTLCERRW